MTAELSITVTPDDILSEVTKRKYINVAKEKGISEDVALEAFEKNKDEANAITKAQLKAMAKSENGVRAAKALLKDIDPSESIDNESATYLRNLISRIERLSDERDEVALDIKEVYAEAKGRGFDVKAIKKIINIRKKDMAKLREEQAMLETYANALQMELF